MSVLLTAEIFALPGVEAQLQLGATTPAPGALPSYPWRPFASSHAALIDLNRNRAIPVGEPARRFSTSRYAKLR